MFVAKNQVRMHDTDMAGRLYFARQFRFAHDALEDFMAAENFAFDYMFHESNYAFVIVHCEADYYAHLKVGDKLSIHVTVEHIGDSSFIMHYQIYRDDDVLVGKVKLVHVAIDTKSGQKISIPDDLRQRLAKHLTS